MSEDPQIRLTDRDQSALKFAVSVVRGVEDTFDGGQHPQVGRAEREATSNVLAAILSRAELAKEGLEDVGDATTEEVLRDLVGWLRHSPGCIDHGQDREWCPCGLETMLGELRRVFGIDVVRCRGCGVHAITPDGTEDWAWRKDLSDTMAGVHVEGDEDFRREMKREVARSTVEPFCHGCAVAAMEGGADDDKTPPPKLEVGGRTLFFLMALLFVLVGVGAGFSVMYVIGLGHGIAAALVTILLAATISGMRARR